MSSWKILVLSFFGCGIAFWVFDVIIPAFDPNEQGYVVTAVCPVVLILFYAVVQRIRRGAQSGPSTAVFAVFGMWILALSFTMLAQSVRGNGFRGGQWSWGDVGYLVVSSFIPTRVFNFVILEGSMLALVIGTVAMIACHLAFERSRWIVPPGLWAVLRHVKQ